MSTVSQGSGVELAVDGVVPGMTTSSIADKLHFAQRYVEAGWHVLLVRPNKTTYSNCERCNSSGVHNPERCTCLFCHGVYAATRDFDRLQTMFTVHPDAVLAVRTGRISGVIALDFDTKVNEDPRINPDRLSGLDVHDRWEEQTGGTVLTDTLVGRTRSGGLHRIYRTDEAFRSRNGILPSTDIKAEAGYVVVPPAEGRAWLTKGLPAELPSDVGTWLRDRKGSVTRRMHGLLASVRGDVGIHSMQDCLADGCPTGVRDEFTNSLAFQLRKNGVPWELAEQIMRSQWERMDQPVGDVFEWRHVIHKMTEIWRKYEAEAGTTGAWRWFANAQAMRDTTDAIARELEVGNTVQMGRKTMTSRGGAQ
jgi:hypothetical protein